MRKIEELATMVTAHVMRNEGGEGVELWKQHSIYKVPGHIAAVNAEAFTPKVVSMGPYHHGQDLLKPMEVHKQRAARVFIQKSKKSTKDFIKALWEVLPELMASYSQLDHVWMGENNKGRFLELMLIDGCFLLELLRVHSWNFDGYESHDPVFSRRGLAFDPCLILDQFMLENQVPFTAIEKLLTVQNGKTPEENCKYINNLMCLFAFWRQDPDVGRGLHMLDVVRKIMVEPKDVELRKEQVEEDEDKLLAMDKMRTAPKFWSVTELCEAGVKFKAVDDEAIALSSVDFENRVLTIPIIRPPLSFEVMGCNIIAFEVIHHRSRFLALSYFTFMSSLLATAADVRYLRSLKILQSTEFSDDAIVQTFKKVVLGTPVIFPFSNLYGVQDQLNELYMDRMTGCRGRLWGWITSLKHNYLKSPWTFLSVVTATLLLVFTMTQTYYAALPYWDSEQDLATRVTQHIMLKEGEEGVELWKKHSIYKVHAAMAAVNPEAFTPKVVSMGPYHHGKEHLMPMEVHKQRAARRFIEDSGKSIEDFIDGLWKVLPELMDSYSQLDRVWREDKNKGRFLEMMLIDGCFLLEILRTFGEVNILHPRYDHHDPVFSPQSPAGMKEDLMMLENQVPFTALEKLWTIQNDTPEENPKYIKDLMLVALYGRNHTDHTRKGKHMLDVARRNLFEEDHVEPDEDIMSLVLTAIEHGGFVGANKETLQRIRDMTPAKRSWSVTELCRAGVEFRKAKDETIPLSSIRFEDNGVITIPVIPLHLLSEVQGCNMVAFELIRPGTHIPTGSYFTFMKGLLTSATDVRHLRTLKIIQSTEPSDYAIVETFQRIAKHCQMVLPGTNLYQVQDQLDKFYLKWMTGCRGTIWEWITYLKQKYFKNPWTSISVAAAIILLVLSAVQTYYTVLPYWDTKHRKNN